MLALRSMMATAVQNSTRQIRRKTGGPGRKAKGPLPSLDTPTRPKSYSEASLPGQNASRRANSSSASNVKVKRNVRQRKGVASSVSDTTLARNFSNLSISNKKKPTSFKAGSANSTVSIRKSTSAGSSSCKTLEDVARLILMKRCKNIVVMAGAGISTPSQVVSLTLEHLVQVFMTIYSNTEYLTQKQSFDIDFFRRDPRPFFTLAKELYPGACYKPNYVHYFCRMLHEKGILLRMYTQNIDGLERLAGIPASKLVEAHGTFLSTSCTRCGHPHDGQVVKTHNTKLTFNKEQTQSLVKPSIIEANSDMSETVESFYKKSGAR